MILPEMLQYISKLNVNPSVIKRPINWNNSELDNKKQI